MVKHIIICAVILAGTLFAASNRHSTFSNETFELFRSGHGLLAAAYALVSLAGGLAAVGLGWWVAR